MKDVYHFSSFIFFFFFVIYCSFFLLFVKSKCVFFATELNNLKRKTFFILQRCLKKHRTVADGIRFEINNNKIN